MNMRYRLKDIKRKWENEKSKVNGDWDRNDWVRDWEEGRIETI